MILVDSGQIRTQTSRRRCLRGTRKSPLSVGVGILAGRGYPALLLLEFGTVISELKGCSDKINSRGCESGSLGVTIRMKSKSQRDEFASVHPRIMIS